MTDFRLDGRVALVTGASRGIGRSIALGLARAGARVALMARDAARTAMVEADVREDGGSALALPRDVSDRSDRERVLAAVRAQLGGLDILVNNAALYIARPPSDVTEAEWDSVLDTNLKATFFLCQAAYPLLAADGGGSIINVASPTDFGIATAAPYAASKAGMEALTRSLVQAWAAAGVRVNTLVPGLTRTDMGPRPEQDPFLTRRTPLGYVAEPEELVGAAVFLASPASRYMTGQRLVVDGGLLIAGPFRP